MKRRYTVSFLIIGILLIFLVFPKGFVYAQGVVSTTMQKTAEAVTEKNSIGQDIANFLHLLISVLSRGWVFLATLAGKLMTNAVVYGEFINLDVALWKLRNIMKNFANFIIGFFFLRTIVRAFFDPKTEARAIVDKILRFVLAGVGVQASWFLIGALIDIQTILVASFGSFPAMILSNDPKLQMAVKEQTFYIPKKITLNLGSNPSEGPMVLIGQKETKITTYEEAKKALADTGNYNTDISLEEFLDTITPRHDSIVGPLVYIGISVFRVQTYLTRTIQMPSSVDISDTITTFLIKAGTLVMYTFAMFIFVVVNVIRVVFLRTFIALSPLLICFFILKKADVGIKGEEKMFFEKGLFGDLSIVNGIKFIFAPVVYVVYFGMALIMIITIQKLIVNNEPISFGSENVKIENTSVTAGGSSFTLIGEIRPNRKSDTQTTILDILLMILTIAMLYGMVRIMTNTFLPDTARNFAQNVRNLGEKLIDTIPIGSTSVGGIKGFLANRLGIGTQRGVGGKIENFLNLEEQIGKDTKDLMGKFGIKGGLDEETRNKLINYSRRDNRRNDGSSFLDTTQEATKQLGSQTFEKDTEVKKYIDTWLTDVTTAGIPPRGTKKEDQNRKKLISLYGTDSYKKGTVQKILDEDTVTVNSIDTLLEKVKKVLPEGKQEFQDFATWLFSKLTGRSDVTIKFTNDFMKTPRNKNESTR